MTTENICPFCGRADEQKKRLIELLLKTDPISSRDLNDDWGDGEIEDIADYLLAHGVIVPPCKVGDTVWCISNTKAVEAHVRVIEICSKGIAIILSFECVYECDGCPFSAWSQDYSGEYSCDGEYGETVVEAADFGKNVFLSREKAEAAITTKEKE